jgi:hypothetical protein
MHYERSFEKLCRYAGRPPLATGRLSVLPDGRLLYRLKRRWRDGTSHIILEPMELMEKLSALVPPPRFNLVRYHGVFAPSAGSRAMIIPKPERTAAGLSHPGCPTGVKPAGWNQVVESKSKSKLRPRNYSWAQLMTRVFDLDVLECSRCGGRMRILCAINPPPAIRKILACLGLPSRPPPIAPARSDRGTSELWLS